MNYADPAWPDRQTGNHNTFKELNYDLQDSEGKLKL